MPNPLRRLAPVELIDTAAATVRQVQDQLNRAALLSEADLTADAAQAFGISSTSATITRREAMTIPAVKRGRGVICGVVSSLPLVQLYADGRRVTARDRRGWVDQPDPALTLAGLLTWTVDDLIFHPVSWWRVTSRYADGFPHTFERLAPERVMVVRSHDQRRGVDVAEVWVDGARVDDRDLVRFDAPDEGLLRNGARALRTAIVLEEATARLAKLDVPLGYLRPAEGAQQVSTQAGSANDPDDPELSEAEALLDTWEAGRETRNTAFLNRAIEYVQTQLDATKIQLNEQREAQAVEVARLLNLEPRYVAAPTGDSSTYATVEGNRRELLDVSLAPFVNAIEQRLSMGDVTPRGQRVRLARAAWMRGDLLSLMQAAQIAKDLGAISADEIRTEYLGLPPGAPDVDPEGNPSDD